MQSKQKRNLILLGFLILAALLTGLAIQRFAGQKTGVWVNIQVNGEIYKRLPLNEDMVLTVGDEAGGYNRIKISEGAVSVTEADCPDQICVREGKIKDASRAIACLPHKLIITVEGEGGYDGVAG